MGNILVRSECLVLRLVLAISGCIQVDHRQGRFSMVLFHHSPQRLHRLRRPTAAVGLVRFSNSCLAAVNRPLHLRHLLRLPLQ